MNLKASFFCDDVRLEQGNKMIAIGIYNESLVFPPGEGGMGTPKLAAVFVVRGLAGVAQLRCRQTVAFESPNAPVSHGPQPPLVQMNRQAAADEHNFVWQMAPVRFPAEGRLTVRLEVIAGEEHAEYACSLKILRHGSQQTLTPSSGVEPPN